MKRRSLLLIAPSALFSLSTFPQGRIDGPGGRFEDGFIENLEGDWLVTRQIRGTTVQNTLHATWVLSHQFLEVHMKDVATPSRYEAIVLIGYVYESSEYIAHWTDSFGGKFSAVGRGKKVGNSVEFQFEYPDGPFFNTFTWDGRTGAWQMKMENQDRQGKRSLFAIDTLQRPK